MKKKICLILLMLFSALELKANDKSGGVVVGNGAGIVENNFQMVYLSLESILDNCLNMKNCPIQDDEKLNLIKIKIITKKNTEMNNRLVFVSEKSNPGFFTTGEAEINRIAKTALTPDSPIYINSDLLYEAGKPVLTVKSITALLVHELGHQAGLLDHRELDILGAKVAIFSDTHTDFYGYQIENDPLHRNIVFSVTNFDYPVKSIMMMFNWKNEFSLNLSAALIESTSCKYDSESFEGVQLTNGHYSFDKNNRLLFEGWVKIFCYESFSGQIIGYNKNLSIALDSDFKIRSLIIE